MATLICYIARIAILVLCVATDYFSRAYSNWVWPFLGFFLLPSTTLMLVAAMLNNHGKVGGWWALWFIAALAIDLCAWRNWFSRKND